VFSNIACPRTGIDYILLLKCCGDIFLSLCLLAVVLKDSCYLLPMKKDCPKESHPCCMKKMVCQGIILSYKKFVSNEPCGKPKQPVYAKRNQ